MGVSDECEGQGTKILFRTEICSKLEKEHKFFES